MAVSHFKVQNVFLPRLIPLINLRNHLLQQKQVTYAATVKGIPDQRERGACRRPLSNSRRRQLFFLPSGLTHFFHLTSEDGHFLL